MAIGLMSSTRRVDTPARYMSISASSNAFLASPVSFDHRGLEDRALELGNLQAKPAGLDGQAPLVVTGAVRLPLSGTLVSGGVDDPPDLLSHHGAEFRPEHGLIELYDFLGHGSVPLSNRGFHRPATENRTRPDHVPFRQGRNLTVRKNSGVIP